MNHLMRSSVAVLMSLGVVAGLVGCAGPDAPEIDQMPSTTAIPTPTEEDTDAGPVEPLEQATLRGMFVNIYLEQSYPAKYGCGCSIEDGGPELWPAGTQVMLFRITLSASYSAYRDSLTVPDLTVTADVAGAEGGTVPEERESAERAKAAGIAWQPSGLFPDGPGELRYDVPQSFMVAYYVPEGLQRIDFTFSDYYDPAELDLPRESDTVKVPLPTGS